MGAKDSYRPVFFSLPFLRKGKPILSLELFGRNMRGALKCDTKSIFTPVATFGRDLLQNEVVLNQKLFGVFDPDIS